MLPKCCFCEQYNDKKGNGKKTNISLEQIALEERRFWRQESAMKTDTQQNESRRGEGEWRGRAK
jgi:hypothetical protein